MTHYTKEHQSSKPTTLADPSNCTSNCAASFLVSHYLWAFGLIRLGVVRSPSLPTSGPLVAAMNTEDPLAYQGKTRWLFFLFFCERPDDLLDRLFFSHDMYLAVESLPNKWSELRKIHAHLTKVTHWSIGLISSIHPSKGVAERCTQMQNWPGHLSPSPRCSIRSQMLRLRVRRFLGEGCSKPERHADTRVPMAASKL